MGAVQARVVSRASVKEGNCGALLAQAKECFRQKRPVLNVWGIQEYTRIWMRCPALGGFHEVRFEYHPKPFYTGITVTTLFLLILIL